MKHRNIMIALGVAVVVVHFLGFPLSWEEAIYSLLGLAIIALAYEGGRGSGPTVGM